MQILWLIVPMLALIALRVPIAYAIGASAVGYALVTGSSAVSIIQRAVGGIDSFTLLAVPMFILAAEVMTRGGLARNLMDFLLSWLGPLRGGLASANIGGSVVFGGISGAAVADAAGLGRLLIPQMVERGYTPSYAAGVTASSSLIGPILPPSIPFIVYGLLAQVSVGALFFAGIVPALLMAVGLMSVAYGIARKRRQPTHGHFRLREAVRLTIRNLPALALPVLIIGGLRFGIFTPTEAGAAAVFYAFVYSLFYTRLSWNESFVALRDAAARTASILIILAFAAHVGWLMSVEQVPAMIAEGLLSVSDNRYVILAIVVVFLLLVGVFLEALAAMLILVPILAPAMAQLGVDPIHFGVIVVLTLMMGLLTPPVGLVLYIVSDIATVDVIAVVKAALPFFAVLLITLTIVVLAPGLVLALPTWAFG